MKSTVPPGPSRTRGALGRIGTTLRGSPVQHAVQCPESGVPLSRRSFLAGAVASFVPRGRAPWGDPKLSARPRAPYLPVERGLTRLGPQLDRGALLHVPGSHDRSRPAPLVVALHGSGGAAARWGDWFDRSEARGFVLLAPDSRGRTWDRVGGAFGPDVRFLDSALRHAFARCAVDPGRVALMGFSDGASYALSLGPSNGDLFTHLIAFSPGFSDPEPPIVGRPRVFVSHGTGDRVLPVAGTGAGIVPMFEMDGYETTYEEFDGGHEMPPEVVESALDWLLG